MSFLAARLLRTGTTERGVVISQLRMYSQPGGSYGKMGATTQEEFFYKQSRALLEKLKEDLHVEMSYHEEQIKRHQEAIERHKNRVGEIGEVVEIGNK